MQVGDRFRKINGYTFEGVIVAIFTTLKGETRIVGELVGTNGNGMLHIFSPNQIQTYATIK